MRTISIGCTFWKKDYATATVFHFLVYLHRKSQKMKSYNWNTEKNKLLRETRNISFEEIVLAISQNGIIEVYEHPNQEKYPGQKIYEIDYKDYIYLVPYLENENEYFLKTIIPSRKATKKHKRTK